MEIHIPQHVRDFFIYGGSFSALMFFMVRILFKKWLDKIFSQQLEEFKRYQNQEFEKYRHEINSLFNRITKIHEKEFEILPLLWKKIQKSYGGVNLLISPFDSLPTFENMTDVEINNFLNAKNFLEYDKKQIIEAEDKTQKYRVTAYKYDRNDVSADLDDLHNFIRDNKIFLSDELNGYVTELDARLFEAMLTSKQRINIVQNEKFWMYWKEVQEKADPLIKNIENIIRNRLKYSDA